MITQSEVTLTGKAGQPVDLPIAEGPATGYTWTLNLPPGVTRVDDAPGQPAPPGRHLGANTSGNLRVTAPAGHYRITARYARPWEQAEPPLRTLTIDLVIQ